MAGSTSRSSATRPLATAGVSWWTPDAPSPAHPPGKAAPAGWGRCGGRPGNAGPPSWAPPSPCCWDAAGPRLTSCGAARPHGRLWPPAPGSVQPKRSRLRLSGCPCFWHGPRRPEPWVGGGGRMCHLSTPTSPCPACGTGSRAFHKLRELIAPNGFLQHKIKLVRSRRESSQSCSGAWEAETFVPSYFCEVEQGGSQLPLKHTNSSRNLHKHGQRSVRSSLLCELSLNFCRFI